MPVISQSKFINFTVQTAAQQADIPGSSPAIGSIAITDRCCC